MGTQVITPAEDDRREGAALELCLQGQGPGDTYLSATGQAAFTEQSALGSDHTRRTRTAAGEPCGPRLAVL